MTAPNAGVIVPGRVSFDHGRWFVELKRQGWRDLGALECGDVLLVEHEGYVTRGEVASRDGHKVVALNCPTGARRVTVRRPR